MFIPVCTWCPFCNSDISYRHFHLWRCTLAADGKQAGGDDGGGGLGVVVVVVVVVVVGVVNEFECSSQ